MRAGGLAPLTSLPHTRRLDGPVLGVGFARPDDPIREDPGQRDALTGLEVLQTHQLLAVGDVAGPSPHQHRTATIQRLLLAQLQGLVASPQLQPNRRSTKLLGGASGYETLS